MVFLKRTIPANPKKRPATPSAPSKSIQPSVVAASVATLGLDRHCSATGSVGGVLGHEKGKGALVTEGEDQEQHLCVMVSLLAEAGCTLHLSGDAPPSLPADPHKFRRHIETRLSSADDPSILPRFLSGFSSYIQTRPNLRRVLIPASHDVGGSSWAESLVRLLLLVAPIQPQMLNMLLEKLPEHFSADAAHDGLSLKDDIARLIVNQLRWLDFIVDSELFAEKLMDVLSISPAGLKKEIIGSLPEIIGDRCHVKVVAALEKILLDDSQVIVPVLDSFTALNLEEQLQEQAVTLALSHMGTVDREHIPHLLRFLLLSATPINAGRIISQIRERLKFSGVMEPYYARNEKLKGKSLAESTDVSILDALKSSLRFKNILCEAVLKVLKSLDQSHNHKVIDLWLLMLMYNNGQFLQKNAYKILKKKIVDGYFCEVLFDQCTVGHRELVKDYFPSFVSLCEYLLSYKEKQMRQFGIHLYASLVGEFKDTYSRQEVLGALVTHSGSGIAVEVSSALETLILLTSRYIEDLTPMSLHTTGILGYMEYFQEDNLHKVNEIFSRLALFARSLADAIRSSIANETLTDMYTKCGEIDDAFSIFHRLPSKDVYSWTALIDGLAVHGPSLECLHLFSQMLHQMTYASSLLACSGMRTLREGQQIHEDLENSGLLLDLHVEGPQMDMYSKYDMIDDASHIVLMILPLLSSSLLNSEVMHRMYGVSKLSELTFPPKPGW